MEDLNLKPILDFILIFHQVFKNSRSGDLQKLNSTTIPRIVEYKIAWDRLCQQTVYDGLAFLDTDIILQDLFLERDKKVSRGNPSRVREEDDN